MHINSNEKYLKKKKIFDLQWLKLDIFCSKKYEKYLFKKFSFWVIDKQCSWCRCLLLGNVGIGLQLFAAWWCWNRCCWLAAASSSHGVCRKTQWGDQRWSSKDFLNLAQRRTVWMREKLWLVMLGLQLWLVGFYISCFDWW